MELGEVGEVHSNIDGILANEQWVDDATGLIPHCLSVLKTCRCLTERLTGLAMNSVPLSGNFAQFVEVFYIKLFVFLVNLILWIFSVCPKNLI